MDRKTYMQQYNAAHKDHRQAFTKQWKIEHPSHTLFYSCRDRAKELGLPFNISVDDIQIPEHCPVLGIRLEKAHSMSVPGNSPSVDRLKPELGYVKGNVCVISMRANRLKNNATIDDLEKIVAYMKKGQ